MASLNVRRISGSEARSWMALAGAAGLVVGVLAGPVLAASPAPGQPVVPVPGQPREHVIAVSGTGTVFLAPDVADVTLGVTVQRPNLAAARDDAAQAMSGVIAALRALGIADADIRTTQLYVSPTYDYSSTQQRITGYQVSNLVAVHVRDLDVLSQVIDDSVAAGATDVNGITFDIADRSAAESQAREAAVRDARARADTLAAAAGVTITGVASISESYAAPWPWPAVGFARDESAAATPVQPGTSELSISVSIEYLIQ